MQQLLLVDLLALIQLKNLAMKLLSFSTLLYSAAVLTASPAISTDKKALIYGSDDPITLVSDGVTPAISILDFGQNFEGHPVFEVVALSGDTSRFEVTFAESAASLSQYEVCLRILSASERLLTTCPTERWTPTPGSCHGNTPCQRIQYYQNIFARR